MQLARIKYTSIKGPQVFIGALLGNIGNFSVCLKAESFSEDDAKILMKAIKIKLFKQMGLEDKIEWCKHNIGGFKQAFRTLKSNKMIVEQVYAD